MARKDRKKLSQTEIDQRWIDEHGSLQWAGGVIVKTPDGYAFEYGGRTMTLAAKKNLTTIKLSATKAAAEISRINQWNRVNIPA